MGISQGGSPLGESPGVVPWGRPLGVPRGSPWVCPRVPPGLPPGVSPGYPPGYPGGPPDEFQDSGIPGTKQTAHRQMATVQRQGSIVIILKYPAALFKLDPSSKVSGAFSLSAS